MHIGLLENPANLKYLLSGPMENKFDADLA